MDAKPQRPRVLRSNDENLVATVATHGKSLHTRTKSTPSLSTLHAAAANKMALNHRKVLGEANKNVPIRHKDDIGVGTVSPAKLSLQEGLNVQTSVAPLARPAVRPLAPKAGFSQNTHAIAVAPTQGKLHIAVKEVEVESDAVKNVAPKKSQILKDVLSTTTAVIPAVSVNHNQADVPRAPITVPQQEVHRIQSVPLRGEAVTVMNGNGEVNALESAGSNIILAQDPVALAVSRIQSGKRQSTPIAPQNILVKTSGLGHGKFVTNVVSQTVDQFSDLDLDDDDGYVTGRSMGHPGESTSGLTLIFVPQYTEKAKAEIAAAKAFVEATRPTEDIEDEQWDTSMVAEYGDEIFEYMHDLEARMAPNALYMEMQHEIQWSMRAVLLDWVVQVHSRFNLLPETLFLTVNFIDRFLSVKVVSVAKLQLVGATALFLAAKYEEVNCPTLSDLVYMVDGQYQPDELLRAERFMLNMLNFELGWPGPMSFLRRISKADDYDLETRTLSKYFLEVTLMDERFVGCHPSFLAAGAHCLARMMLRSAEWTPAHVYYSNYTMSQLRRLVVAIYEACKNPGDHHGFVYEKYSEKRYRQASLYVRSEIERGFNLSLDVTGGTTSILTAPPPRNSIPALIMVPQALH